MSVRCRADLSQSRIGKQGPLIYLFYCLSKILI